MIGGGVTLLGLVIVGGDTLVGLLREATLSGDLGEPPLLVRLKERRRYKIIMMFTITKLLSIVL